MLSRTVSGARMNREALCQSVYKAAAALPESDRAAFDEAREKAPNLILEESSPLGFIRFAAGDHEAAAKRLVAYWNTRKNTFEDRFLLPLNLSGRGALSEDDIETLKTGFISLLPDDCTGRKVIYFDNSMSGKLLDGFNRRAPRFRCLFYMSSLVAKEGKPCVLIRFSNTTKTYLHKAELVLGLFNSLPVELSMFLNLYQAPPGARRMFEKTVISLFEGFPDRDAYADVLKSYIGDTPEDLLTELSQHGLMEDCIPSSSGGSWNYSDHEDWLESREKQDRARYCYADVTDDERKPPAAVNHKNAGDAGLDDLKVMKARAERKRLMDRKYSEQRRQREKKEESTLYNQYVKLNAKNKELRGEERRLQSLLSEAEAKVSEFEASRVVRQESAQVHQQRMSQGLSNGSTPLAGVGTLALLQQQQLVRSLLEASLRSSVPSTQPQDPATILKLLQRQHTFNTSLIGGGTGVPHGSPQVPQGAQAQQIQLQLLRDILSRNQGSA